MIEIEPLNKAGIEMAQQEVVNHHYLHQRVDTRCSLEGYRVIVGEDRWAGVMLLGRPEATKVLTPPDRNALDRLIDICLGIKTPKMGWYGSVADAAQGRAECTRWQVLNLARVWISPKYQYGGSHYSQGHLPGYFDRHGMFRSTLASTMIRLLVERVGFDYLVRRPPVYLDEPYAIQWLLSYCDTRLHSGTIYQASGFHLYRTNEKGIQTWRISLPSLTADQDAAVREASRIDRRAQLYRAKRQQLAFQGL